MNSHVPASAYAERFRLRHDVHHSVVIGCQRLKYLRCAVGRMVIDDDDVELEVCLLRQCRFDSVRHRFLTITHRYHHRRLKREFILVELDVLCPLAQVRPDLAQMLGAYDLVLLLNVSVFLLHVVKLLLAALSVVLLACQVQRLAEMKRQ